MAIFQKLKNLIGSGDAGPKDQPQQPQQPVAPPQRTQNKSITEQVAAIKAKKGPTFRPAWQQEDEDPAVSAPGRLVATNVHHRDDEMIDVGFEMDRNHLTLKTRQEGRLCKIVVGCINGIELRDGRLRIDLHLPIPLTIDGELRAVRSLFAEVKSETATARWTWLSSQHARSYGECSYCFKSALEIEPQTNQPYTVLEDGEPLATAHCRACKREFRYHYAKGAFEVTSSPE